jgi:hypothetical protein
MRTIRGRFGHGATRTSPSGRGGPRTRQADAVATGFEPEVEAARFAPRHRRQHRADPRLAPASHRRPKPGEIRRARNSHSAARVELSPGQRGKVRIRRRPSTPKLGRRRLTDRPSLQRMLREGRSLVMAHRRPPHPGEFLGWAATGVVDRLRSRGTVESVDPGAPIMPRSLRCSHRVDWDAGAQVLDVVGLYEYASTGRLPELDSSGA